MFVVGNNLRSLVEQFGIADYPDAFDETSLTLRLSRQIKVIDPGDDASSVAYGDNVPEKWIRDLSISDSGYNLNPGDTLLGCSVERIKMPAGYIGFVQTKGSLARLFITVHCCDAQIEPGFEGRITFEIVNLGPLRVTLRGEQEVAQLFVAQTSTNIVVAYNGRYQGADGPTTFCKPTAR